MGCQDSGQACVVKAGSVIAREGPEGTDAMIAALEPAGKASGILFKAPKPGQDRRADLPVIGPGTALAAAKALLDGIVIEAGGVMVIDLPEVREILDGQGMFLWVRPRGSA
jgi:UDP-2,3-diacylglucosamine hydrolase